MVVRRSFPCEVVPFSGTCQFSVEVLLWQVFSHRTARRKWGRHLAPSFIVYFGSHCLWHSDEHVLAWCPWEWNQSTCTYHSPEYTIDVCDPIHRYRSNMVITNILHGSSSAMGLRKQGMAVSHLLTIISSTLVGLRRWRSGMMFGRLVSRKMVSWIYFLDLQIFRESHHSG